MLCFFLLLSVLGCTMSTGELREDSCFKIEESRNLMNEELLYDGCLGAAQDSQYFFLGITSGFVWFPLMDNSIPHLGIFKLMPQSAVFCDVVPWWVVSWHYPHSLWGWDLLNNFSAAFGNKSWALNHANSFHMPKSGQELGPKVKIT